MKKFIFTITTFVLGILVGFVLAVLRPRCPLPDTENVSKAAPPTVAVVNSTKPNYDANQTEIPNAVALQPIRHFRAMDLSSLNPDQVSRINSVNNGLIFPLAKSDFAGIYNSWNDNQILSFVIANDDEFKKISTVIQENEKKTKSEF